VTVGQPDVDVSLSADRSNDADCGPPLTNVLDHFPTFEVGQIAPDGLLVLPENQFALSVLAGLATAETGVSSPHVFLYGPAGAGKSNVLRSATAILTAENPTWRTLTLTAADFAARFTEAAETRAFRAFRKQFQHVDLLIMEDLQAISGRFDPQRQLIAAWDDALAHQCRLVVSCRSGSREVGGLLPEIVNRCHGAIHAPLSLPALPSRLRLLEHWTGQIALTPEVLPFVAEKFAVSPRELQGVVTQLKSLSQSRFNQSRQGQLELEAVRSHLLGQHPRTTPLSADIAKCVARHFQVTLTDLRAKSRQPGLVLPRQCAMFLIRELTDASLKVIGQYFGGRDHTTVLHACHKVQSLLPEQPDLRQDLAKIRTQLLSFQ